jgi:hypothetical protein
MKARRRSPGDLNDTSVLDMEHDRFARCDCGVRPSQDTTEKQRPTRHEVVSMEPASRIS